MMRRTLRPAISPAALVALRCESLKYAGTVITASVIDWPSLASASAFNLPSTIAEISCGLKVRFSPATSIWMCASPLEAGTSLYGTFLSASESSENLRPINRFAEKIVFCGLVTACRFAA